MFFFNWCIIYSSVVKHLELNQDIIYIALKFNLICIIIQFEQIQKLEKRKSKMFIAWSIHLYLIYNLVFNNSISEYVLLAERHG